MVIGLDKFQEYFKDYPNSYVIIGGTACDIIIEASALTPRATKDIDIILVIEALSKDFVKQFWKFINDGQYNAREKNEEKRNCYRFMKPETEGFPMQVELFSREPDVMDLPDGAKLTPIPVGEDLSSLSAILMDDEYYSFTIKHSTLEDELNRANTETLICLKAKAFLNLTEAKENKVKVDEKNIKKHKNDVFRMVVTLAADQKFELPQTLKSDLQNFVDVIKNELPDKAIFKELGAVEANPKELLEQLIANFDLKHQ